MVVEEEALGKVDSLVEARQLQKEKLTKIKFYILYKDASKQWKRVIA